MIAAGAMIDPPPEGMTRVLAFTVATAMAWLGHECTGGCPAAAAELRACVWYERRFALQNHCPASTVAVVDLCHQRAGSEQTQTLLSQVDRCARRDGIAVRERLPRDGGRLPSGQRTCCGIPG
ncbi:hypothetical protein BH10ACT8_BH10ACT8_08330 [soil metagenome]|jgi:hypothetical protein